ncbi:hypothetical protein SAMN05518871_104131 [Psychrobacillus sp. OK028]|uniref:hypothetical protein n=1 Tax=Psychrobacillus sp. OK028 TaxID=1884359 RepID=UPI00088C8D51|nr:hypothetical protein [Psychrobacillus sp. OK028]SDN26947.1 hypothetical protein SAMN05518871_104131 [Psychrobacillus sp. OK028]
MRLLPFILIFVIGVILTVALSFMELSFWFIYIVIIVVYTVLIVLPPIYTLYKSNNLKKVERFLEKNKRKPLFAYPLAVRTGNREEIISTIQLLLSKYKQPYMQEVYKTNLALFENNISQFEQRAKQISKEPLHTYYVAYAEILKGNFDDALALKDKLPVGWMPYAIDAIIAIEKGDLGAFRLAANESIRLARGVQKFNLIYSFKWMEKENKN